MSKIGAGCTKNIIGTVDVSNFDELCECIAGALAAGIELAGVEVGCALDVDGSVIGKVFLTKQVNEDGTGEVNILSAVLFDDGTGNAAIVSPYAGAIGACASASLSVVTLEELCVNVDGVPQPATPVSVIDPILGEVVNTLYLDEMGSLITGVVTPADACDCGCPEPCPEGTFRTDTNLADMQLLTGWGSADGSLETNDPTADTSTYAGLIQALNAAGYVVVNEADAPPIIIDGPQPPDVKYETPTTTIVTSWVAA